MFFGTTPSIVSQYLQTYLKENKPQRFFDPYGGIFVMDQIVGSLYPDMEIIAGEVSTFSVALGYGIIGEVHPKITPTDLMYEMFPIITKHEDPIGIAANVIIATEISRYLSRQKHLYYRKLIEQVVNNQEEIHEGLCGKILEFRDKVGSNFKFLPQDSAVTLQEVGAGDFVWYDPPYNQKDYDHEFSWLDKLYNSFEIPFTPLDAVIRKRQMMELDEKGAVVFARPEIPIEIDHYEEVLRYQYKINLSYYLYSNVKVKRFYGRVQLLKEHDPLYRVITRHDRLTNKSKVALFPMNRKAANHYREMWTEKAVMRDAGAPFALTIDGMLIAIVAFMDALKFGSPYCVIVADAVPPDQPYAKLSKLVLHIILTEQTLKMVNNKFVWQHTGFTTVAFSNRPASMKYRNHFKCVKREDALKDGSRLKFKLIYQSKKIYWNNWKEAYNAWFQKYGKEFGSDEAN